MGLITAAVAQEPTHTVFDVGSASKLPGNTKIVQFEGERVLQWDITRQKLDGANFPLEIDPRAFDSVRFRYRILDDGCKWFGVKIMHREYTSGNQYVWRAHGGGKASEGWQWAAFDLQNPDMVWDGKNSTSRVFILRSQSSVPKVRALVGNILLVRDPFRAKLSPAKPTGREPFAWSAELTLTSRCTRVLDLVARAEPQPTLTCTVRPAKVRVAPGQSVQVTVRVALASDDAEPLTGYVVPVVAAEPGNADSRQERSLEVAVPMPRLAHPFLTLRAEDIPAIKAKAAKYEWAKAAYDNIIKSADKLLAADLRVPDEQGQWYHFYACKKCGARLRTARPVRNVCNKCKTEYGGEFHTCPKCGSQDRTLKPGLHVCKKCKAEYSGEPYDRVPITSMHGRLARAARTLGLAYQFTQDARYGERAKHILVQYADKYERYPYKDNRGRPNRGGKVIATHLSESVWLIPVAQAYDLVAAGPFMSPADREAIEQKLLLPSARVCKARGMGIHNISCWRNAAIGCAALASGNAELARYAINSKSGIKEQVRQGIQDDGVWFENSWGYHFYALSPLCYLAQACSNIGIDVWDLEDRRLKSMFDAPLLFAMPNGRLPAFNDTGSGGSIWRATQYEYGYAHYRDTRYMKVLARSSRKDWVALLYGAPLPAKAADTPAESRNFPSSGIAVLRSGSGDDAFYLALDYGPHGGGHGHPDKLGFVTYGCGQILAMDPGSIQYSVPLHRQWYRRSLAHNVIVVDGQDQRPATGRLGCFAAGQDAALAHAHACDAYPGVEVTRTIGMVGDTVVVIDRAVSDKVHTYDWVYHNRGELRTDLDMAPFEGELGPSEPYRVPTSVQSAVVSEPVAATWSVKDAYVALTLHLDRETEFFTAVAPGFSAVERVPMVLARQKGRAATFVWAFTVRRGQADPVKVDKLAVTSRGTRCDDREAVAVRVRGGGGDYVLALNETGRSVSFEGFTFDGKLALLVGRPSGWEALLRSGK